MKKATFIIMMTIASIFMLGEAKAQNAQIGKDILSRVGIEAIKMAWKGTRYTPLGAAIGEFLKSTSVVDDATEMAQIRSIQELEGKAIQAGYDLNNFYNNLDSYLRRNSSSLCDDGV